MQNHSTTSGVFIVISTVFVALDGSDLADSAIASAAQFAARADAPLVLLGVGWSGTDAAGMARRLDARIALLGAPAETRIVADGSPADALLAVAAEPGALVCMTTRGRGAVRAATLGSTAESVLRASPSPVVLMGEAHDPEWVLAERPVILAGVDHSETAGRAARAAGEVAAALGGTVHLVEAHGRESAEERAADEQHLAALVTAVTDAGGDVEVDAESVDWPEPVAILLEGAEARPGGLIAVGTHGRSGVRRVALGSVAMRVVQRVACPVLVAGPSWAPATKGSV